MTIVESYTVDQNVEHLLHYKIFEIQLKNITSSQL